MKKTILVLFFAIVASAVKAALPAKYVVVPNRSDSSITLLSSPDAYVLKRITAQDVGFSFEPIYASHVPRYNMVAVSDRKNSQLIFFDNKTFKYLGAVPASEGMFHMWPSTEGKYLFAVADIDRVVDVIAVNRFDDKVVYRKQVIHVGDLFTSGKPHDVVVDENYVFVTMIGVEENGGKVDYVIKYDKKTLKLLGKKKFSFDIHLGIPKDSPFLLVPEQTAGRLNFVDKETLKVVTTVENVPGAHGIYWNADASKVYLANFTSQGPMSVYEVRQTIGAINFEAKLIKLHSLTDAKAHNITVDFENQMMFVTHSGPNSDGKLNTEVSVFSVAGDSRFVKSVETGMNPLGILLVDTRK